MSACIGLIFGGTTLLGTTIVHLVNDDTIWMFIAPTALAIVAVPWLAYLIPDRPATAEKIAEVRRSGVIGRFWINPIKRPDFGWLVLNRLLVYMGLAFFLAYQVFSCAITSSSRRPASRVSSSAPPVSASQSC